MDCSSANTKMHIQLIAPHGCISGDLVEGDWRRRGCRVQCARFGLRVYEWSMEVHAACVASGMLRPNRGYKYAIFCLLLLFVQVEVHMKEEIFKMLNYSKFNSSL
jgi:hypothetical protein